MSKLVIAGTGHRPDKLWGYNLLHPNYIRLKSALANYIKDMAEKYDEVVVISGMALGFDTVLAQATLLAKKISIGTIKLECAIPCKNHTAKWKKESVDEWNNIVKLADVVTYVSDKPYTSSCMQKRNEYMVDSCDELIALWNGTSGGTKNCIDYAKSRDKKIMYLTKVDK